MKVLPSADSNSKIIIALASTVALMFALRAFGGEEIIGRPQTQNRTDIISGNKYILQLAVYGSFSNAQRVLAQLGSPNAKIVTILGDSGDMYLIYEGSYSTWPAARLAAQTFTRKNPGADYWIRDSAKFPIELKEILPIAKLENIEVKAKADERAFTLSGSNDNSGSLIANGNSAPDTFTIKVDELWMEYGAFPDSDSLADRQSYVHSRATATWSPKKHWEIQLAVRVDGYYQQGKQDTDDLQFDYGETYVRYGRDNWRITAGAQKILWGRVDEFPPIDRLSTQDLSRIALDNIEDRRRASGAIRFEHFSGNSKLDVLFIPFFREAELAEKDNVWFPLNQQTGDVIGLKSTPITSQIIKNAKIDLSAPSGQGGAGVRYTGLTANLDYGVTIQRGRQTTPYFTYDANRETIHTVYPRTWVLGGDFGMEALGGTIRFEAAWLSDTPVTSRSGNFSTVESVSWGGSYEFFPGDGDARINLQLMGNNMLNAPNILDRDEVYAFSGSIESPFANETWRFKTRFNIGLNEHNLYINPEIAYTGWYSQELYLDMHYFNGSDGTPGGFHEDHSLISVGWRRKY